MDSRPLNRHARAKTFPHRFEHGTLRPDLRVAIHAGLRRRNAGKGAVFHRRVAVAAVDAVVADVMFVAEWHRLAARYSDFGEIGRFIDRRQRRHKRYDECGPAENAQSRKGVGARMKNLRHGLSLSCLHRKHHAKVDLDLRFLR